MTSFEEEEKQQQQCNNTSARRGRVRRLRSALRLSKSKIRDTSGRQHESTIIVCLENFVQTLQVSKLCFEHKNMIYVYLLSLLLLLYVTQQNTQQYGILRLNTKPSAVSSTILSSGNNNNNNRCLTDLFPSPSISLSVSSIFYLHMFHGGRSFVNIICAHHFSKKIVCF